MPRLNNRNAQPTGFKPLLKAVIKHRRRHKLNTENNAMAVELDRYNSAVWRRVLNQKDEHGKLL